MKYKGYEIKSTIQKRRGFKDSSCIGIFHGDKVVSYAVDMDIAKRAVDAHTKSGIWPILECAEAKDIITREGCANA